MDNDIRRLRAELGWSQSELARRLGVSRQTVNAIENGRYDPSLPLAFRISRVFARPIERIFSDPESTPGSPSATETDDPAGSADHA
jgi:putative transcriptional regulator